MREPDWDYVVEHLRRYPEPHAFLFRRRSELVDACRRVGMDDEDLYSAAFKGLMKASRFYRPNRGKPGTFANRLIVQSVVTELARRQHPRRRPPGAVFSGDAVDWQVEYRNRSDCVYDAEMVAAVVGLVNGLNPTARDWVCRYFGIGCKREPAAKIAASTGHTGTQVMDVVRAAMRMARVETGMCEMKWDEVDAPVDVRVPRPMGRKRTAKQASPSPTLDAPRLIRDDYEMRRPPAGRAAQVDAGNAWDDVVREVEEVCG